MADERRNGKATLGCGTLILIALIVLILGNAGNKEIANNVRDLEAEVRELSSTVEAQTEKLEELRELVKEWAARDQQEPQTTVP